MTDSFQKHLQEVNLIYLALIGGQIMICAVVLFLTLQEQTPATASYLYLGPLISILTITAAFFLHNKHKREANAMVNMDEKLGHHRASYMVKWGLLEGGNFINLIFFFMEGNFIYLLFFSMGLIAFLFFRPTEKSFRELYR